MSTATKIEWTRGGDGPLGAGRPVSRPTRVSLSAPEGARDRSPARSGSCLLCIYPLPAPPFTRSRNCSPWVATSSRRRQRHPCSCLCALGDEAVLGCVGLALDVELTAQMLRSDYVVNRGLNPIGELQNDKRVHGKPLRRIERHDLNRDPWQFVDIHEPPEPCMHQASVPECLAQGGLVEHPRQFQRLIFRKQFLPDQPCLNSSLCVIPPRGCRPGGGRASIELVNNVKIALIDAMDETSEFLRCQTEEGHLSRLAVADTDLTNRKTSDLDATAANAERVVPPPGQRAIPRIHRISATAAAAVISNMQKRAVCLPLDMASRSRRAISTTARSFHCIRTPSRCAQRPLDSPCSCSSSSCKQAMPGLRSSHPGMSIRRVTRAQRGIAQIFKLLAISVDLSCTLHKKVPGQAFDEDNITSSWSRESEETITLVDLLADKRFVAPGQSHQMPYDGRCGNGRPGKRGALGSNPSRAVAKAGIASKYCGKSVISNAKKRAVYLPSDMASRSRRAISTTARFFHCIETPFRCTQRPLGSSRSRSGPSWKPDSRGNSYAPVCRAVVSRANFRYEFDRFFRDQRQISQMFEGEPVLVCVGLAFEVQKAHHPLNRHHSGARRFMPVAPARLGGGMGGVG